MSAPPCPELTFRAPPPNDPTSNVMAFLGDAVARQDDLRDLGTTHIREILDLRTDRADDLRDMEQQHRRETLTTRLNHEREIRDNESNRIDAILTSIQDTAVTTAATAETRATTLATTVTNSADAMRAQVAAAAQASNDTLDRRFDPIQKRIDEISRFQFETQGGRAQIVDTRAEVADMQPILQAIAKLTEAQTLSVGQKAQVVESHAKQNNTALWIGLAVGVLGVILPGSLTVIGIIISLVLRSPG